MSKSVDKQAAIDEVQYEIEMINNALDSLTLDYNTREKMHQRKGEARKILNSIETLPAANLWIPCKERLPQEDEPVLVTDYAGSQHVWNITRTALEYLGGLCWEDDYGYYQDLDDIIAWMPLPEPYKEKENGAIG